jgi:hypothetical protein
MKRLMLSFTNLILLLMVLILIRPCISMAVPEGCPGCDNGCANAETTVATRQNSVNSANTACETNLQTQYSCGNGLIAAADKGKRMTYVACGEIALNLLGGVFKIGSALGIVHQLDGFVDNVQTILSLKANYDNSISQWNSDIATLQDALYYLSKAQDDLAALDCSECD